jgi:hypothetical protein
VALCCQPLLLIQRCGPGLCWRRRRGAVLLTVVNLVRRCGTILQCR